MPVSRRVVRWAISLVLLATVLLFLFYPSLLADTPLALLYTDIEMAVVVVLFAGMWFMLFFLLYLGSRGS